MLVCGDAGSSDGGNPQTTKTPSRETAEHNRNKQARRTKRKNTGIGYDEAEEEEQQVCYLACYLFVAALLLYLN